jgi:hypothetical protein
MTDVLDGRPPRFGRVRWAFVRGVLWALNVFERWASNTREWALNEAVASSPDFSTFEAFITRHYSDRGLSATVSVVHATVTSTPVIPKHTHVVSTPYLN